VRVERRGALTYLYYANGCSHCREDFVVVRDCRVVGGRFDNPGRVVVQGGAVDSTPPPAAECRAQAAVAEPGETAATSPASPAATVIRQPPPPTDVSPGGALPAQQPQ